MQDDSTQAGTGFGGHFNSNGGSQFMGNSFSTGGGTIHLIPTQVSSDCDEFCGHAVKPTAS